LGIDEKIWVLICEIGNLRKKICSLSDENDKWYEKKKLLQH